MQGEARRRGARQPFAPGEQHARAAARGEPAEQGHGQRRLAEERREFAVAGLRLLVRQDADHAALLQALEQGAHAGGFGADLLDLAAGIGAHPAQEGLADRRFRRPVQDRQRRLHRQPLVQQFPVAHVRRGDDQPARIGQDY